MNEEAKENNKETRLERIRKSKLWSVLELVMPILAILVAITIPILIFIISQKEGEITVRGLQNVPLIDPDKDISKQVEIFYQNQKISNLSKYILKITNTGNTDIDGSDVHYFRWSVPEHSRILSADISNRTPGLGKFISVSTFSDSTVELSILTLNKEASATLVILCSSDKPNVNVASSKIDAVIKGALVIDKSSDFSSSKPSFVQNLFVGGIGTNVAKFFIFYIIGIFIILVIFFPVDKIHTSFSRKKKIKEKNKALAKVKNDFDRFIVDHNVKDDLVDYIKSSFVFFKDFTPEQLKVCANVIKELSGFPWNIVEKGVFNPELTSMIQSIPKANSFLNMIIYYKDLYRLEEVVDYFLEKNSKRT